MKRKLKTSATKVKGVSHGVQRRRGRTIKKRGVMAMKPINLNKLIEKYYDTGLFLAVSRDHEMVVGTGKTIREAAEDARSKGFSDAVIMKAPSREIKSAIHA